MIFCFPSLVHVSRMMLSYAASGEQGVHSLPYGLRRLLTPAEYCCGHPFWFCERLQTYCEEDQYGRTQSPTTLLNDAHWQCLVASRGISILTITSHRIDRSGMSLCSRAPNLFSNHRGKDQYQYYQLISTVTQNLERLFDLSIASSGATIDIGTGFDELQEYARMFYTLGLSKVPMRVSTKNQSGYPRRRKLC
jgi:hypothetical protein